jgi:hypothetical protein
MYKIWHFPGPLVCRIRQFPLYILISMYANKFYLTFQVGLKSGGQSFTI